MEKLKVYCPFCDKEHDLILINENVKTLVNNQEIEYDEKRYFCDKINEEFMTGSLLNENLLAAKDIYRKSNGLLTSNEIEGIRKKYNLSQADLSLILGWGEVTITRYETKEIQNVNYDIILRQISEDPYKLYDYFKLNKCFLSKYFKLHNFTNKKRYKNNSCIFIFY